MIDILRPSIGTTVVGTTLMAVRPSGRMVHMGGVGVLGGVDLAPPYLRISRTCITIHGR